MNKQKKKKEKNLLITITKCKTNLEPLRGLVVKMMIENDEEHKALIKVERHDRFSISLRQFTF